LKSILQKIKLSKLTFLMILFLGITSFVNLRTNSIPDAKIFFIVFLFFFFLKGLSYVKFNRAHILYLLFYVSYTFYSLVYVLVYKNLNITDFSISYLSLFYLIILIIVSEKKYFTIELYRKIFKYLLYLFFLKYLLALIFHMADQNRPSLYIENNFELVMLLILYIVKNSLDVKFNKNDFVFVFMIFILSGSRSGIFSFFCALFLFDFGPSNKIKPLKYLFILLGGLFTVYIFASRMGGGNINEIDRVIFLKCFLYEIKYWNWRNYIFGNLPLTPVSQTTAITLSYYKHLFSDHEHLIAYSVLFHSYILRVIYDHGFLTLVIVFSNVLNLLIKKGFNRNVSLSIIGIIFLNALSVSSLNSIFIIFPLFMIITLDVKDCKFET